MHDDQHLLAWVPRLRRYARALAGDRDDADDLVQVTLERAWATAGASRGAGDTRAWLFGVMHNVYADGVRQHRPAAVPLDDAPPEPAAAARADRWAQRDLQAALAAVPPEQREVLLLVALEDMTYADVARTLGIPVGTVTSRLARGRERLRALMEDGREPRRLEIVK